MDKQTVLIVEDRDRQREALEEALDMNGFSVRGVGDVEGARKAIAEIGDELGLMVLDMHLRDPRYPAMTGAELGLEVREANPRRLPEFLILSAYSPREYYELAVRLGVAAYLAKEDTLDYKVVIRHVRALMIKRNLSMDAPTVSHCIAQISDTSDSLSDAAVRFCREVLSPVMSSFLGSPFVILMRDDRHIPVICQDGVEMAESSRAALNRIEELLHSRANSVGVFVASQDVLRGIVKGLDAESLLEGFKDAAFLSVPVGRNIRLTVGIFHRRSPLTDEPAELASVLSHYLARAVLEPLLYTLAQCISAKARRDAQLLAHSCSFIAQEQLAILSQALDQKDLKPDSRSFRRLMALSEGLRDTAQLLMLLENDRPANAGEPVSMAALVRAVIEDIGRPAENTVVEGDCTVAAFRDDLFIACSRIFQWFFFQRQSAATPDNPPPIHVTCSEAGDRAMIKFEDESPRLSKPLRQRSISPFAEAMPFSTEEDKEASFGLPLYLAKSLIELKGGGQFEDRSDDLPGNVGHKFVLQFPSAS